MCIFIGEAEETWPRFLADWQAGRHAGRYEQAERTDMTKVPAPRFDLLKMRITRSAASSFRAGARSSASSATSSSPSAGGRGSRRRPR